MISIFDPRVTTIPTILDAKLCNYYLDVDTSVIVIESITDYLIRIFPSYRSAGVPVTILLPLTGDPVTTSYDIEIFDSVVINYKTRYYTFEGGLGDINFKEIIPHTINSVTGDGFKDTEIQLINDELTPGPRKYYGTDVSEIKGYHDLSISTKNSVKGTGIVNDEIQLVNDEVTPGSLKYYGTNVSGVKGYYLIQEGHPPVTISSDSINKASIDGTQVLSIKPVTISDITNKLDDDYGLLYNWWATQLQIGGASIAPLGWHIPSKAEWETMLNNLDAYDFINGWWPNIGGYFKEAGLGHWNTPNEGASNIYGFGVLGSGHREAVGFELLKEKTWFWASTPHDSSTIETLAFSSTYAYARFENEWSNKYAGNSIRLVKDDDIDESALTDIDGNIYPTVKIGNQVWMAVNLRVKHYNDGTKILNIIPNADWLALNNEGAWCRYGNDQTLLEKFDTLQHNELQGLNGGDAVNNYFGHLTENQMNKLHNAVTINVLSADKASIDSNQVLTILWPTIPTTFTDMTVQGDGSTGDKIRLINDSSAPGINQYYGTNAAGTKGYFTISLPASELSIQGDGTLSSKIKLVNDVSLPGSKKYYGTDIGGTKGYHTLPDVTNIAFTDLTDVIPDNYITKAGFVPIVNSTEDKLDLIDTEEIIAVLAQFTLLADVPNNYVGKGGWLLRVKADETGLEFYTV